MNNNDFVHDLDDKELDMMLKYVPDYSEDNARNIKNKFIEKSKRRHKKFPLKKLMLIAAAVSMLFVTTLVYANVIDMSRIYKIIFGENSGHIEPYIEPLVGVNEITTTHENSNKNESESIARNEPSLTIQSEYDGIVIKLISAINDENVLRIFATVVDTTGDRLGETLDFVSWGLSQGYGGGFEIIDYNNETKTATVLFTSLGSDHQGNATLSINGLSIGRELLEDLPENNINIIELLKGHTPTVISQEDVWKSGGSNRDGVSARNLYESSRLLKCDEMNFQFNNTDMFSISNTGFVDGLLHIQARTELNRVSLTDGYYINVKFVNSEGEIVFEPAARIDFIADRKYAYQEYALEPHNAYSEMIFDGITSLEQLNDLSIVIDYMKSPKITEGNWEFSFAVPEKVTTEFQIDKEITINGGKVRVDMVSLSPLGVTIHLSQNMSEDYIHGDKVFVEYKDGNIIALDQSSIHTYEGESTLIFGGNIIDINEVRSIIVNDETINISN